jgi:ferredoxin-NADP reductase
MTCIVILEPAMKDRSDWRISPVFSFLPGTGIAPMIQIIRAFIRHEVIEAGPGVGVGAGEVGGNALRLVYAADTVYDLAFAQMLEEIRSKYAQPIPRSRFGRRDVR